MDASGDYLSIPGGSDFNFGTDPFTLEMWLYRRDTGTPMFSYGSGNTVTNRWVFEHQTTYINVYNDSAGGWFNLSNLVSALGVWEHYAFVFSGGTTTGYKDGVAFDTDTSATTWASYTDMWIGALHHTSGPQTGTNALMDQIRISDTARYTSTFTPSTTPFTTDANTKLLIQSDWSEGGLGADHSGNYNYFTPTNLVASDMMEDSPMNNFATWNPLTQRGYGEWDCYFCRRKFKRNN